MLLNNHSRPTGTDHQHPTAAAHRDRLVVEIHGHHGVAPEVLRLLAHLVERDVLGLAELLLVRRRPAPDDVPDAGEEIAEDIGTEDRLAAHEPDVLRDLLP